MVSCDGPFSSSVAGKKNAFNSPCAGAFHTEKGSIEKSLHLLQAPPGRAFLYGCELADFDYKPPTSY